VPVREDNSFDPNALHAGKRSANMENNNGYSHQHSSSRNYLSKQRVPIALGDLLLPSSFEPPLQASSYKTFTSENKQDFSFNQVHGGSTSYI